MIPIRPCCGQRHMDAICPDGKVMCCLCFDRFPLDQLHLLPDGRREDVCEPCAIQDQREARRKCPTCNGEGVEFAGDDDIGDACSTCGGSGLAIQEVGR